jgi:hypothetical protein
MVLVLAVVFAIISAIASCHSQVGLANNTYPCYRIRKAGDALASSVAACRIGTVQPICSPARSDEGVNPELRRHQLSLLRHERRLLGRVRRHFQRRTRKPN